MDFNRAIKNLNRSLSKKQPLTFNQSWVKNRVRKTYNYITKYIKTELGETDWDSVICRLDHQHQKLWLKGVKVKAKASHYENSKEVETILTKYQEKLYSFLVQLDKEDKKFCDLISIKLVRVAQKGNLLAKARALDLIKQLVDQWIDNRNLKNWRGYDDLIEANIERCIRRYRYSGSFLVYLYRTLEYAGRGLRSLEVFSLDDFMPMTAKRRSDNLVYDSETGEARFYGS